MTPALRRMPERAQSRETRSGWSPGNGRGMSLRVVLLAFLLLAFPDEGRAFDFGDALGDLKDLAGDFDLGGHVSQALADNFKKLPGPIKDTLGDPTKLFSLSASDFKSIPLDVLGNLKSTVLDKLNATHLQMLAANISTAPASVLDRFFNKVPAKAFKGSLDKLKGLKLSAAKYYAVGKAAVKSYGKDVSRWTSKQFLSLGNLNFGLTKNELAKIPGTNFSAVIDYFNSLDGDGGTFSSSQVQGLFQSAKNAWGNVKQWSKDQLGKMQSLSTRLPEQYLAQLDGTQLAGAIKGWSDKWAGEKDIGTLRKKSVLINKLKTAWQDVSQWTEHNVQDAKGILDGLSVKDMRLFNSSTFFTTLTDFLDENRRWSWQHFHAMAEKAKAKLPDLAKLSADRIEAARRFFPGLLISDLKQINITALLMQLRKVSDCQPGVQENFAQVEVLANRVLNASSKAHFSKDFDMWNYDALDDLGCLARGFLCDQLSDIPSSAVANSDVRDIGAQWSRSQVLQILKKLLQNNIKSLDDLETIVYGVSTDDIARLSTDSEDLQFVDFQKLSRPQLFALIQRLKSIKTNDLSDESDWGWDAIKNFGSLLLSLSPMDLSSLPEESYEDAVSEGGVEAGWTEGQARAIWRTLVRRSNLTADQFVNVTDRDMALLGSFVAQIGLSYLDKLDSVACKQAVQQIGQTEDLASVTSPRKRAALGQWAIKCLQSEGPVTSLTSDHLILLGRLVLSLNETTLDLIGRNTLSASLGFIGYAAKDATDEERQRLANLVKKRWSNLGDLTGDQITALGNILKGFSSGDLGQLNAGSVVSALEDLGIGSNLVLNSAQSAALISRVKATWGSNVGQWGADRILRLGGLVTSLTRTDLQSITADVFNDVVDHFGWLDGFDNEKSADLLAVAKKAWGSITSFSPSQFRRLGHLAVSISSSELSSLAAKSLGCSDTAYALGQSMKWSPSQLRNLLRIGKEAINSAVSDWDDFELTILGNISVALNVTELQSISATGLRRSAGILGKVVGFSNDQKSAIVNKLKTNTAWGSPRGWTRSQINEAGSLLSAFSSDDVKSLSGDKLGAIDQTTIGKLGSNFFSAMTSKQLESLEPQQARIVSASYSSSLTADQNGALQSASSDDLGEEDTSSGSSAASTTMGGIISLLTMTVCLVGGLIKY